MDRWKKIYFQYGGIFFLIYQDRWVDGVYMERKDSNGGMTEEEFDE